MPVLYRASLGYLLRHPWQFGLAMLGICAGVSVMVAIDLANESSRKAFSVSMDAINGKATHQIVAGPGGVDETFYSRLRVTHGIRSVAPVVSGYVQIQDVTLELIGVDIFAEQEFRTYTSTADLAGDLLVGGVKPAGNNPQEMIRALLTAPGAVFMSNANAQRFGLQLSDAIKLTVAGREHAGTLAGIFNGADDAALQSVVVVDIAAAQMWLDLPGRLTRIDVRSTDEDMLETIRKNLPANASLLTASSRTQATIAMSDAFTTNLSAMSLLALLVGVFLIYNSVTFAVLQRRQLIGVLRVLGVSRVQVFTLIISEAFALGIIGALVGIFCGIILGEHMVSMVSQTINDHYFVVSVTDVSIAPSSIAKGLLAGLGATLIAAAIPALEATNVQPRLAIIRSTIERTAGTTVTKLAIGGVTLGVVATVLLRLSGSDLFYGLVGVFLVIFAYALLIPAGVRLLSRILLSVTRRFAGITSRMAVGGISASLSRTGVAIVALAIAVSTTIGVSIMVHSFRVSVGTWLDNSLQSDVYVGVAGGSLDEKVLADLVALPDIDHFSTSRRAWSESANGRIRILALQMAPESFAGFSLRSEDEESAWAMFTSEDVVMVSDPYAYKHGVAAGDSVIFNTQQGSKAFPIAAIYQSYDSNDGTVLFKRETYDRYFYDSKVDSIGLYLAPGVTAETMMQRLRDVSRGRQSLIMNSNIAIRELSLRIFDRTFVITNVLYWLAVGVAFVGILGAMLALQLERAREFGILRAVGMTPWQVGRLVAGQSTLLGFISGIAAIPLGIIMAVLLIEVINRRAFGWQMDVSVTLTGLAAALLLAVAAAFFASLFPAFRAAKAQPALAMREE
jgi:putative ABC transport system permease protein